MALEIKRGLDELFKDDEHLDCVTAAVAAKVAREMSPHEQITMDDFEMRAMDASEGLTDPNAAESYFSFDCDESYAHG